MNGAYKAMGQVVLGMAVMAGFVGASEAKAAKFTLTNNTGHGIRVHFYNNNDSVLGVAKANLVIPSRGTRSVNLTNMTGKVTIKVFKQQFPFDQLVATKARLSYNGKYVIDRNYNVRRRGRDVRKKFTLRNNTKHDLRVHIYDNNDSVLGVAGASLVIPKGGTRSVKLNNMTGKVTIKVFKKQFPFDQLVATKSRLEHDGRYQIDRNYNVR